MILLDGNVGRFPMDATARFLAGAVSAAALCALAALAANPRIATTCLEFGKGGALCSGRTSQGAARGPDCMNFGRAGRLCASEFRNEARSRAKQNRF